MKRMNRSNAQKMAANVAVLEAALHMVESNLRGSRGSERDRLQVEADAIRAQLRELGV